MIRLIRRESSLICENAKAVVATEEATKVLADDPRWQLVERILATGEFSRSPRLSEFLRYVSKTTLEGRGEILSEQHLGEVVFGRPEGYDPGIDSIVRSHALRLRQRLDQFFARAGRHEAFRLHIPRGSYAVVFESAGHLEIAKGPDAAEAAVVEQPRTFPADVPSEYPQAVPEASPRFRSMLPWSLTALLALVCIFLTIRLVTSSSKPVPPPWPLSTVFDGVNRTQIVIADANYGMLRLMNQHDSSLEQYSHTDVQQAAAALAHPSERETRMLSYALHTNLTSYADIVVAANFISLMQDHRDLIGIRSARELRLRDLEDGNYVFVGSPGSNPWVSLFQSKLNFKEGEGVIGDSAKYFLNTHPRPGEQERYPEPGSHDPAGEQYAAIALLPTFSGHGSVLIIQGLHQGATEAAGLFLVDDNSRKQLRKALNIPEENPKRPVYFEVLIRAQVIAGAPNSASIVAVRVIPT